MTLDDRIVIMKDGVIQQVGTPREVFDHPVNLFLAGFIGVPQTNFFDAELVKENDKYVVTPGDAKIVPSDEKQDIAFPFGGNAAHIFGKESGKNLEHSFEGIEKSGSGYGIGSRFFYKI